MNPSVHSTMQSKIQTVIVVSSLVTGATFLAPGAAQAFTYSFDSTSQSSNSPATGASAFVDFEFNDVDASTVELKLTITNTTGQIPAFGAGATSSKLTGIGFDLLGGLSVVGGSFTHTGYLDTFLTNASFSPFPRLGVAIADNNNFLGGNANDALSEGVTTMARFQLTGFEPGKTATDLESAFYQALSEGVLNIGARFQQVNAGEGSDKLSGGTISEPSEEEDEDNVEVPEPATLAGLGLLAGLLAVGRRRAS